MQASRSLGCDVSAAAYEFTACDPDADSELRSWEPTHRHQSSRRVPLQLPVPRSPFPVYNVRGGPIV